MANAAAGGRIETSPEEDIDPAIAGHELGLFLAAIASILACATVFNRRCGHGVVYRLSDLACTAKNSRAEWRARSDRLIFHSTCDSGRVAYYYATRRHVFSDDGTRTDHGPLTDGDVTHNDCAGADRCPLLHQRFAHLPV